MINANTINVNCIGCGLCASLDKSITFGMNNEGYLRPEFPANYEFNNLIEICPIFYNTKDEISNVWGPYLEVYKGYAIDNHIRKNASSGGIITAILQWLIKNGEIDGVIQIGMSKSNPIENEVFLSTTTDDLLWCAGSRYAPASPLISIDNFLQKDGRYAFVGRPCDVRALRKYSNINPIVDKKVRYIFSFFCAGTPSLEASKKLIRAMGAEESTLKTITYRGNGWPGYAQVEDASGIHQMEYEKSWGGILGRTKQQFCRICPEGTGDEADISCGDGWNLTPDRIPDFSEGEGMNIIFARTELGRELLKQVQDFAIINVNPFDIGELKYIQPYQFERKTTLMAQACALKLGGKYVPDFSRKQLKMLAKESTLKKQCRILAGTIKRIKTGNIK